MMFLLLDLWLDFWGGIYFSWWENIEACDIARCLRLSEQFEAICGFLLGLAQTATDPPSVMPTSALPKALSFKSFSHHKWEASRWKTKPLRKHIMTEKLFHWPKSVILVFLCSNVRRWLFNVYINLFRLEFELVPLICWHWFLWFVSHDVCPHPQDVFVSIWSAWDLIWFRWKARNEGGVCPIEEDMRANAGLELLCCTLLHWNYK